jgi:pimeloyl-ACP methyl ester carboxylesterase
MFDHRFFLPAVWVSCALSSAILAYLTPQPMLFGVAFVIASFNAILEFFVGVSFLLPGRRKPSFQHEDWLESTFQTQECTMNAVYKVQEDPSPLLFIVHGWRSSSRSIADRSIWFSERGWHVIMVELPNHGSSGSLGHWSAFRSLKAVGAVGQQLNTIVSKDLITSVTYYGHSMGGFIGLRLGTNQSTTIGGHQIERMILESPMTMYEPILDEIAVGFRVPKIIRPMYRRRLIQRFNRSIGQPGRFSNIDEFNIPKWGKPMVPMLCVQANPDERLGMIHYNRLLDIYSDKDAEGLLDAYLLDSLSHAGARKNDDRNQKIAEWLEGMDHSAS